MKELIKKIAEISAPSGRELPVLKVILAELENYIDGYRFDSVGNLIVWKKGYAENPKKLLLDGHADEIGVVITNIDEKGFLRIDPVGGVNPLMLLGTTIRFNGTIGIVSMEGETAKELTDNYSKPSFDNLFVDIGVNSKAEALSKVHIGMFGTYNAGYCEFEDKIVSKSLDDRIACAIIIQVFKEIRQPENDLYGVFSVQEEVGLVGASVAAFDIKPDMAVAIDVTAYSDTPKTFKRMDINLGNGPAIKVKDKASISDEKVVNALIDAAKSEGIPYQMEVLIFGGTNAAGYQMTGAGIKSGTLSIPCRYVHSPHEMVSYSDVQNAVKLLKKLALSNKY